MKPNQNNMTMCGTPNYIAPEVTLIFFSLNKKNINVTKIKIGCDKIITWS